MIIPKSKCRLLYNAVDEYMKKHDNMTPENREILAVVLDKITLVISGDATGLDIDQIYDPTINSNKITYKP